MKTMGEPDNRKTSLGSNAEPEPEPEKKSAAKNCCKKTLKFLFSHIGLCLMVVAYAIAGGFIFQHLEKPNEKAVCSKGQEKYGPMENNTKYKLWMLAKTYTEGDVDDPENEMNALSEIQKLLSTFRDNSLDLGYNGENCSMMGEPGGPSYSWGFPGALLFSVTVITTIGMSHNTHLNTPGLLGTSHLSLYISP